MTLFRLSILTALFMLLTSYASIAQNQHESHSADSATSHDAHVHGVAELLVVLEGNLLEMKLHSPAMNLLGFEHHATTPEQKAKVESTRKTLADVRALFQFNPAFCQIADHTVDFGAAVDTHANDEEGHDITKRSEQHDARGHNNIEASYRYRCERPDELHSLSTLLPDAFPGIRSLQVQWIVGGRQGAVTLDNGQHRIIFR